MDLEFYTKQTIAKAFCQKAQRLQLILHQKKPTEKKLASDEIGCNIPLSCRLRCLGTELRMRLKSAFRRVCTSVGQVGTDVETHWLMALFAVKHDAFRFGSKL